MWEEKRLLKREEKRSLGIGGRMGGRGERGREGDIREVSLLERRTTSATHSEVIGDHHHEGF